jgi:glycosyltransferase involved in cell wall biosynthesis
MTDQPHIAVLSLHPLFDTRVANHLKTLIDAGFRVTYVNWSRPTPFPTMGGLERVELVQHDADPAFGHNIARYMGMLRWFRRRTLELGAQLVHIHDLFLLPLAPLLRESPGRRFVFDVHEQYDRFVGRVRHFARLTYPICMPFVDGVVGTCEANVPTTSKPSVVVPNYQELSAFRAMNTDGPRRVIYFGSLSSEDREVGVLLDVAESCLASIADVQFEYGGRLRGGDAAAHERRMQRMAERFGGRFKYYGQMTRDQVVSRTGGATAGLIFVRPDSPNRDGGSWNKIYEYLCAGAAICATEGFDISDDVRREGAGLVFATGTHAARIADELKALLNDPPRLAAMQAASARLGRRFSWGQVRGRYIDLYHQLGVNAPHAV